MARRRRRRGAILVALLAAYSLWQFADSGTVSWPGALLERAGEVLADSTDRSGSGFRRAAATVEELGAAREGAPPPPFDFTGRVVRVADGDTLSVLDGRNRQHKVRLFGIDTPERDQPHGTRSLRALAELVADRRVGVVVVETDDYGRTVGNVYLDDRLVNLVMVQGGHAWWYRYYAPHERALEAAEQQARARGAGLWADPRPVPPWDWRRGRR